MERPFPPSDLLAAGRQPPAAGLYRRFTFRLDPLLRLRRIEEERAKAAFLASLGRYREKSVEIDDLRRRREEAKAASRESQTGSADPRELLRVRRILDFLCQRIAEKRGELETLRPALEESRAAHRKAAVRRRKVEKLRDRRWREFLQEEERRERREFDEIAQTAFIRAARETSSPKGEAGR